MVNLCAMMSGLAILLLDSTLVQTRAAECLRPHAYAHSNAGKLYRTARGRQRLGPVQQVHTVSARLRVIFERLPHGKLVQTRISR